MKVCLVFQRRFAPIAHRIAVELKAQGVEEFCGYVYRHTNMKFLKEQRDITYSSLLLDEDIFEQFRGEVVDWNYLQRLEREIGLPYLWPYISVDRIIRFGQGVREYPHEKTPYSHTEMAQIVQTMAKRIDVFLEREKPDLVYIPVISAIGNMLLFHLAKKKGLTVLVGAETRIKGGYAFSEEYTSFSFAKKRFEELMGGASSRKEKEARSYIREFREKPHTYHYVMKSFVDSGSRRGAFAWLSPSRLLRSVGFFLSRISSPMAAGYAEQALFPALLDSIRRKARLIYGFGDLWDTYDPKESFVYFPLHLEPELAVLLLAPHARNQTHLAQRLAESLPLSYKLYVKEHPAMVGYRPRKYYKTLKEIPNVKLIHPNHDSHAIIRDAKLTATITGTAGWESALLGKPVITFGNVYFNNIPGVRKSERPEYLAQDVKEQLENFSQNDNALVNFIAALLEKSENVHLHEMWEKGLSLEEESKNLQKFVHLLLGTYSSLKDETTSAK